MSGPTTINLGIILNCILVNENVRPAMLVQPADYGEATGKDPKTKHIIEEINKYFPELIQSEAYEVYQGIIISKTDYNGQEISLERMGEILGYPCYKEFEQIDPDEISYIVRLHAVRGDGEEFHLISNACKDKTTLPQFNRLAVNAKQAFNLPKYRELLGGSTISNVKVIVETDIPIQQLINNLIKNNKLEDMEIDAFINVLYNFGFSEKMLSYKFQYNNPVHKGIILDLLLRDRFDTLSPFYPIQDYPKQQREINEIIIKYESALIDALEKTKISHRGGKPYKTRKLKTKLIQKRGR